MLNTVYIKSNKCHKHVVHALNMIMTILMGVSICQTSADPEL